MPEPRALRARAAGAVRRDELRKAVADYDFNTYTRAPTDFCNEDLPARSTSISARTASTGSAPDRSAAARGATVFDTLFHTLIRYAAPVMVFTSRGGAGDAAMPDAASVHLLEWPDLPPSVRPDGDQAEGRKAARSPLWTMKRGYARRKPACRRRRGDRGDRAAAARQDREDRASRPRRAPARPPSSARFSDAAISPNCSSARRAGSATRAMHIAVRRDRRRQVRPLLAAAARSDRGRRAVPALHRGRGPTGCCPGGADTRLSPSLVTLNSFQGLSGRASRRLRSRNRACGWVAFEPTASPRVQMGPETSSG